MTKIDEKIFWQFEDLINEGNEIIKLASEARSEFKGKDVARVTSWVSKSGQMIKSICPNDSVYLERFSSILELKIHCGN